MIKRIAAIAGLLLALGIVAVIGIAIWPEEAGNGDTQPATSGNRALSAAGGPGPSGIRAQTESPAARRADRVRADIAAMERPDDARFALQRVTGPLPVHLRFKH